MRLLIFDTETTGLPKTRESAIKGPNNWPHIVSISWVILDTETNIIMKRRSYIIKPKWHIPSESIAIHKITNENAMLNGVDLFNVINEFITEPCEAIVAHNIEFDLNVIFNAMLWDLNMGYKILPRAICSMMLGKPLCMLPGKFGNYKSPKLKELYYHAFKRMPDETKLHGSMYDVLVLTEVIQHYFPLRQAMGLVASSVTNVSNGIYSAKTVHFNFNETN
jgi:DNA polymerase III epsilon subunit-like protein